MRQLIVAGNWKMNKSFGEGIALAKEVVSKVDASSPITVILGTPYIHLNAIAPIAREKSNVFLAAQNCHTDLKGAFTGEISAAMIQSVGADYVILGHSERRKYFGETDATVAEKINRALESGIKPIVCIGEELDKRESGEQEAVVKSQIEGGMFHLNEDSFSKIVIAYEPVWAIGTGKTASPEQAQEMHQFIRSTIHAKYGASIADDLTILYGGSCKPHNSKELFSQPDVDGGLIGGASLKSDDFLSIINSF